MSAAATMSSATNSFASATPGQQQQQQQQQQSDIPSGQNPNISPAEIRYIIEGCVSNVRSDGRSTGEFRPYAFTPPYSPSGAANSVAPSSTASSAPLVLSNGSSRISLPGSDTDVLCSVRAELVVPAPLRPNEGVVEMNVDLMPSAASGGDNRRRRTEEMEIAAVLTKLLLPHVVDRRALCVVPGKYVWKLAVDVLILACDGNVVDVCGLAIRAAVRSTVLPHVTPVAKAGDEQSDGGRAAAVAAATRGGGDTGRVSDDFVVDGDVAKASAPPGADQCPVVITIFVLEKERSGSVFIVDARSDEELCAATQISVSIDPAGNMCGVHKHGSAPSLGGEGNYSGTLQVGRLMDVTNLASSTARNVIKMMDDEPSSDAHVMESLLSSDGGLLRGHFELR